MLASICGSRSQKPRKQYSRTVKRLFTGVQTNFQRLWRNMERKPLKSHATVVGGHATIGRLSNNVSSTFQANRKFFEKSRWTVTWQWSEVARLSADCQTTIFRRFKQLEIFLKKVAERSRDSGWGHATVGRLSKRFWMFQAIRKFFEKSRWTVTWQWSEVTRPSADCQTNVFWTFQAIWENFEKSRWTVTRQWLRSRDRRPTVKQRFLDVSSN